MKLLGSILLCFAICTIALDGLGHDSALLALMDRWGVDAGRIIRAAIAVCGIGLLCARRKRPTEVRIAKRSRRAWSENTADPMAELHNRWAA